MYWVKYQLTKGKWKCRLFYTHKAAFAFVNYQQTRFELNDLKFEYYLHFPRDSRHLTA